MARIVIRNGTVVTATDRIRADVYCEDGLVRAVAPDLEVPAGTAVLDATDQLVLPGGVDAHVHMELPFAGGVNADDFFTGTAAGLAGGTTTIVDFVHPERGQSLREAFRARREEAAKACADHAFHMAITWWSEAVRRELAEVVREDGVRSFKAYLAYRRTIGIDDEALLGVLDAARALDALVLAHCEHGAAVEWLQQRLLAEGKTGPEWHPVSRPSWLEGEATGRAIALARAAGAPLYVVHVTCREALDAIDRARREGQLVWAETCPHYLLLDDSVYRKPDFEAAAWVLSPPIRPRYHQEALWAALAAGLVHTVATDHCPFRQADQKTLGRGDFTRIPNGAAGIEHRLTLLYTYGVRTGRLTVEQLVDVCCTRPARLFGLYPRKGTIAVGSDADLVVWDPEQAGVVSATTHHHATDRSIFEGFALHGGPSHVLAAGRVVLARGELRAERGAGRYLGRAAG